MRLMQAIEGIDDMVDPKIRALVFAIHERPAFMDKKLRSIKKAGPARAGEPDFVWKGILRCFATWGGVPKGLDFDSRYKQVKYADLIELPRREQKRRLKGAFWDKWGRLQNDKLKYALNNLTKIYKLGGSTSASRQALKCKGPEAKIAFMKKFDGVGDKYARNIWMDVYHPDFRDSIAVDQRLKIVLEALGRNTEKGTSKAYKEHETFFRDIAKRSGVSAWELDRLLFNFTPFFIWAIEATD